jgi:hypothetical protein
MNTVQREKLIQQRAILQEKFYIQRNIVIAQLCEQVSSGTGFPRSETMRFFTGKTGINLVADTIIKHFFKRNSAALYFTQSLHRLFFTL